MPHKQDPEKRKGVSPGDKVLSPEAAQGLAESIFGLKPPPGLPSVFGDLKSLPTTKKPRETQFSFDTDRQQTQGDSVLFHGQEVSKAKEDVDLAKSIADLQRQQVENAKAHLDVAVEKSKLDQQKVKTETEKAKAAEEGVALHPNTDNDLLSELIRDFGGGTVKPASPPDPKPVEQQIIEGTDPFGSPRGETNVQLDQATETLGRAINRLDEVTNNAIARKHLELSPLGRGGQLAGGVLNFVGGLVDMLIPGDNNLDKVGTQIFGGRPSGLQKRRLLENHARLVGDIFYRMTPHANAELADAFRRDKARQDAQIKAVRYGMGDGRSTATEEAFNVAKAELINLDRLWNDAAAGDIEGAEFPGDISVLSETWGAESPLRVAFNAYKNFLTQQEMVDQGLTDEELGQKLMSEFKSHAIKELRGFGGNLEAARSILESAQSVIDGRMGQLVSDRRGSVIFDNEAQVTQIQTLERMNSQLADFMTFVANRFAKKEMSDKEWREFVKREREKNPVKEDPSGMFDMFKFGIIGF